MCTATWLLGRDGYVLLFNRDEKRARQAARPPEIGVRGSVRYVAPRDGNHGGTWIAANSHGLALALHNGQEPTSPRPALARTQIVSRGWVIPALIDAPGAERARERFWRLSLARFRSFDLILFSPGVRPAIARWDGEQRHLIELDEDERPLVSSAISSRPVAEARRESLRAIERRAGGHLDGETLLAYHRSHEPERGPRSPCMHREDAKTVSLTRVQVDQREVRFDYVAGSPCRHPFGPPVVLARAGSGR